MEGTKTLPEVTHDDVINVIRGKRMLIIDVRTPTEFAQGHIPFAYLLPVFDSQTGNPKSNLEEFRVDIEAAMKLSPNEFKAKFGFDRPSPDESDVIIYCRSGRRSEVAVRVFRDQFNFTKVSNYTGSWLEWQNKYPEDIVKAS